MASEVYSKAVLAGLRARGESEIEIRRITGLSPEKLKAVRAGKQRLTHRILLRIQDESGMSPGQLAALSMEPNGGPLTQICDVLAEARRDLRRGKHPAKARQAN
jgi:hypothetical protein